MSELKFAISSAHTCGLKTVSEALSNWQRWLPSIHVYAEIPAVEREMVSQLNSLGIDCPISEEISNMSIYDFNIKYNLGIDFEAEDKELDEFMNKEFTDLDWKEEDFFP